MNWKKGIKIACLVTITCFLGIFLFTPADAQRGPEERRERRGLEPEEMEKIWELQAESVALMLELDEGTTGKLMEAYLDARKKLQEEMMEARGDGGGWERFREMRENAVSDFKSSVESLESEQADEAIELLSDFSFRTDMGAGRLSEILEDETKLHQAVGIVMKSLGGMSSGERGEGREDRRARMEELFNQLGEILSPEELEWFKETFDRVGRRGPGGPRGGQ